MRMKAFLRIFLAVGYTVALLCIQFYEGEILRGFVTLLIIGIGAMSHIIFAVGGDILGNKAQIPQYVSKIMTYLWIIWVAVNLPSVFPFLLLIFSAPLVIKAAFFLFVGTWFICVYLYYEFEDKRKEKKIEDTMMKAHLLSSKVGTLLLQAQEKRLDTRDCEETIEKGEKFLQIGEECFRVGDLINAEICAQSAIEAYQEVISRITRQLR